MSKDLDIQQLNSRALKLKLVGRYTTIYEEIKSNIGFYVYIKDMQKRLEDMDKLINTEGNKEIVKRWVGNLDNLKNSDDILEADNSLRDVSEIIRRYVFSRNNIEEFIHIIRNSMKSTHKLNAEKKRKMLEDIDVYIVCSHELREWLNNIENGINRLEEEIENSLYGNHISENLKAGMVRRFNAIKTNLWLDIGEIRELIGGLDTSIMRKERYLLKEIHKEENSDMEKSILGEKTVCRHLLQEKIDKIVNDIDAVSCKALGKEVKEKDEEYSSSYEMVAVILFRHTDNKDIIKRKITENKMKVKEVLKLACRLKNEKLKNVNDRNIIVKDLRMGSSCEVIAKLLVK